MAARRGSSASLRASTGAIAGWALGAIGLLVASAPGCGGGEPASRTITRDELLRQTAPYDVVIVLLDAAAASHFGFLGNERDTTPTCTRSSCGSRC